MAARTHVRGARGLRRRFRGGCNDAFRLTLELHQDQKVGKQVVGVHSANDIPVTCGTTPKSWSAVK